MADKMSMTDLRRAVMARTDATEQEVSAFYDALRDQIVAAMRTDDQQVKINGLGTFRLQAVAPRKSVNIATGESIIIEGYNKLTFNPEISLKELVYNNSLQAAVEENAPSAEEEANAKQPQPAKQQSDNEFDPLKKLSKQADEIVDILATLGQGPKAKSEEPHPVPTPPSPLKEGDVAETVPAKKPSVPKKTKVSKKTPVETIEIVPVSPAPKKTENKPQKPAKTKKKYHFLRDTLICVCCLLLVLVGGYIFLRETLSQWVDSLREQPATEIVEAVQVPAPTDIIEDTTENTENTEPTQSTEITKTTESTKTTPLAYTEFIATERVRNGSRLAQIARRHYGEDKMDLWVYIYDANKDIIDNPNAIKVGTELRVPRLTEQQMDLTNPDTQAQIEQLKAQIEALGK